MNVGNVSSVKDMAQEALETSAQTKAEAAKGDQQAVRKLAQTQTAARAQSAPPQINSAKGKLNATA